MAAGDANLKPEGQAFIIGTAVACYKASALGSNPTPAKLTGLTPEDTDTIGADSLITFTGLDVEQHYVTPAPVDCVQTLTVDATSGNFRLRYGVDTTAPIKYNVTAANLKAQLELLPSIGSGQIATITGGPGDSGGTAPYVITFGGTLAATDVPALEVLSGVSAQASTALVNVAGGGAAATLALTTPGRPGGDQFVGFLPNPA